MAFTVTPTSGTAPYVYNVTFANRLGLDIGMYTLHWYYESTVGECAPFGTTGSPRPQRAAALLATGVFTLETGSVPMGSCDTSTLAIRLASTGEVIDQAGVTITRF